MFGKREERFEPKLFRDSLLPKLNKTSKLADMDLQTVNQLITDPSEWDGSLFGTQLELVKLSEVKFHSTQTVTDLGDGVKLLRLKVNQPITTRSRPLTLRYVATIFDQAHGGHYAGASIEQGRMLIMPPDFDFDACVKDGEFTCSSVFVPPDALESFYKTITGHELEPFDCLKIANLKPTATQWLSAWPGLVAPECLESLSARQRASIQESLSDSALTMLTDALQSSPSRPLPEDESSGNESRLSKARSLVRLAEDYANVNRDVNIRMVDLCKVTEVSERTLQYAFQTCLGLSPMNYLKRHRLHQVRRELKEADVARSTVSAIACQFGFFHFGDFSLAYKSQFNESPSQTLKSA